MFWLLSIRQYWKEWQGLYSNCNVKTEHEWKKKWQLWFLWERISVGSFLKAFLFVYWSKFTSLWSLHTIPAEIPSPDSIPPFHKGQTVNKNKRSLRTRVSIFRWAAFLFLFLHTSYLFAFQSILWLCIRKGIMQRAAGKTLPYVIPNFKNIPLKRKK